MEEEDGKWNGDQEHQRNGKLAAVVPAASVDRPDLVEEEQAKGGWIECVCVCVHRTVPRKSEEDGADCTRSL